jgi:hypothetical protein
MDLFRPAPIGSSARNTVASRSAIYGITMHAISRARNAAIRQHALRPVITAIDPTHSAVRRSVPLQQQRGREHLEKTRSPSSTRYSSARAGGLWSRLEKAAPHRARPFLPGVRQISLHSLLPDRRLRAAQHEPPSGAIPKAIQPPSTPFRPRTPPQRRPLRHTSISAPRSCR